MELTPSTCDHLSLIPSPSCGCHKWMAHWPLMLLGQSITYQNVDYSTTMAPYWLPILSPFIINIITSMCLLSPVNCNVLSGPWQMQSLRTLESEMPRSHPGVT